MAKTQDYTKAVQDMFGAFPIDTSAFQDAFKNSTAIGERLTKVALEAAEKSTEISSAWTKATLARVGDLSKSKSEPADYAKAVSDFTSAAAETAAENLAAYAEVAKKVQLETVELLLAAGKEATDDASAAVKKATADVTAAAKKATATATSAVKA